MSDLISRQAAIDSVHNYWKAMVATVPTETTKHGTAYDTKQLDEILEHNKKLVGVINGIPSEAGKVIAEVKVDTDEIMKRVNEEILPLIPKWIPVTERLPEKGTFALVTFGEFRETAVDLYIEAEKQWYYCGDDVIAWMPLPEPYREENDE